MKYNYNNCINFIAVYNFIFYNNQKNNQHNGKKEKLSNVQKSSTTTSKT